MEEKHQNNSVENGVKEFSILSGQVETDFFEKRITDQLRIAAVHEFLVLKKRHRQR
jgi:hypothetical protein